MNKFKKMSQLSKLILYLLLLNSNYTLSRVLYDEIKKR